MRTTIEQAALRAPAKLVGISLVLLAIFYIETIRRLGSQPPVPFLILYGSVALSAGYSGLKTGLFSASIAALFVIYCASQSFGPPSLTGGTVQVVSGAVIAYLIAILLGVRRDRFIQVTDELRQNEQELRAARNKLADNLDARTTKLAEVNSELVDVRNRLDNAVFHSPAGVMVVGIDRRLKSINPAALRQLGLDTIPEEWKRVDRFLENVKFYSAEGYRYIGNDGPLTDTLATGAVTDDFQCRIVRPDGVDGWFRCCFAPIRSPDGQINGATIILIDESGRSAVLHKLQNLARKLMGMQENERQYIAIELNDEIGQQLTASKMRLYAALNEEDPTIAVRSCIDQLNELMNTVRNLSLELRPAVLDDLGLTSALRWYLTRQQERTGHGISFESSETLPRLSPELVTACFRIVQESVTNATKHADAASLTVRVNHINDKLCVEIIDDGCGFTYTRPEIDESKSGGFGLFSMAERVELLGGTFVVNSKIGHGTRVTASFQLS